MEAAMPDPIKLTCAACGQGNRLPVDRLAQGPKCGTCGASLVDGRVHGIDDATHDRMTRGDGLPVLVDYWAPWCGPCRQMAPEFAKAAQTLSPAVRLVKLNTEDHPKIAARAGIRGIPALILYRGGHEVARLAGARPAADIVAFARTHTGAAAAR
jgi:thioredoxin 2